MFVCVGVGMDMGMWTYRLVECVGHCACERDSNILAYVKRLTVVVIRDEVQFVVRLKGIPQTHNKRVIDLH